MARRRVVEPVPVDLRAELAARFRQSEERWARVLGYPVEHGRADALDAGLPLEVSGWEVARWFDAPRPFDPNDRLRVEADGSLVVLPERHW